MMGLAGKENYKIEIINIENEKISCNNISHRCENVLNLSSEYLSQFDIIHSNSLIEHLTPFENQKRFAELIINSNVKYFIQTPNYYFPFEPHFLFPLFQFFPIKIQTFLLTHFRMGWYNKCSSMFEAESIIKSIRLLKKKEIKTYFSTANIYIEKFIFFSKSFTLYN